MKHTLLATTALVAMTGAAAAEFTVSGSARVGLKTTEGVAAVAKGTRAFGKFNTNLIADYTSANAASAHSVSTNIAATMGDILEIDKDIAASIVLELADTTAAAQNVQKAKTATLTAIRTILLGTQTAAVAATKDSTDSANRMRVSFTGSGETNNGIAFGATIRADNAGAGSSGTGGSQYVSGAFGKLSMGDLNGADESAAGGGVSGVGLTGLGDHNDVSYQSSAHNIGYQYSTAGVTFGYSQNTAVKTGSNSAMGIKWSGDMGGTTLGVGLGQSKVGTASQNSMSVSLSTGGLTLKAISSSNDNGTTAAVAEVRHATTAGAEKAYAVAIAAANNADTDQTGLSISYAMDAMSVTAFTKTVSTVGVADKDYSGFGFAYDMGGVSLKAGVVDNNDQQLVDFGLSFSF
jgi:outer membrane protein OmpU